MHLTHRRWRIAHTSSSLTHTHMHTRLPSDIPRLSICSADCSRTHFFLPSHASSTHARTHTHTNICILAHYSSVLELPLTCICLVSIFHHSLYSYVHLPSICITSRFLYHIFLSPRPEPTKIERTFPLPLSFSLYAYILTPACESTSSAHAHNVSNHSLRIRCILHSSSQLI
jgi:hypothetical protein